MKFHVPILFCLILTMGCSQKKEESHLHWESLCGRKASKEKIYRINIPDHWEKKEPMYPEYLSDTTLPICEFFIEEEKIRIALHTFPHAPTEKPISPWAQVDRWKRQLQDLDEEKLIIEKVSHNGFAGLYFEAEKKLPSQEKVLAWSLIVDSYLFLQFTDPHYLADLTIKINGEKELIDLYKDEILTAIESIELTKEIVFQR